MCVKIITSNIFIKNHPLNGTPPPPQSIKVYSKKYLLPLFLGLLFLLPAVLFAQITGEDTGIGDGFTASIAVSAEAFNLSNQTFERSDIRQSSAQDHIVLQSFIYNMNFLDAASAYLGYNGNHFGGKFGFRPQVVSGGTYTYGGLVHAWVRFGLLRFTLGNDIETIWTNELGADPGLRIYNGSTWNSFVKPENITGSNGFLITANLKPVTVALCAGDFLSAWNPSTRITNGANNDNEFKDRYDTSFRYGAHIGYEIDGLGKVNASYSLAGKIIADKYRPQSDGELVPRDPDSRMFDHLFGLYANLSLSANIELTVGYNGLINSMLKEYYNAAARDMVEIGYPSVFINGVNLNARWKVDDRLIVRTDNCLTFWQDKNYDVFGSGQSNWNKNTDIKEVSDTFAAVNHFVLWNGVGVDYPITDKLLGTLYLRNLYARYSSSGWAPAQTTRQDVDYSLMRDQLHVKLRLTYRFTPQAEAYIDLIFENLTTGRSLDLNTQSLLFFQDMVHNKKPVPVATTDNDTVFRIPIGITLSLR
jgi:hypothetical protein